MPAKSAASQQKADYSIASPEEREKVIQILDRNLDTIRKQKSSKDPQQLQKLVQDYQARIRAGEIFVGRDFANLVLLFQGVAIY